jgi:hypothetical protein
MLAHLLETPTNENDWAVWSHAHRLDHDLIQQAIQAQKGINLPIYVLHPIPSFGFPEWLTRNHQAHQDMNGALGTQGSDLSSLDPSNRQQLEGWINTHYQEHLNAHDALEI